MCLLDINKNGKSPTVNWRKFELGNLPFSVALYCNMSKLLLELLEWCNSAEEQHEF